MTIQQLHYDFDLKIDKVGSLTREHFNVFEKDWLLNEAQNVIVKQRYSGNNPHKTSLDQTEKRYEDLSTLHVKFPEQPAIVPTLISGIYTVDYSSLLYPAWFITRIYGTVNDLNCGLTKVSFVPVQTDDLNESDFLDPFNKSSILNGVSYNVGKTSGITGNRTIHIYPNNLDITEVNVEYIKKPVEMSIGGYEKIDGSTAVLTECELPEHLHSELVDIAVSIASGIIEHPNFVSLTKQKIIEQE